MLPGVFVEAAASVKVLLPLPGAAMLDGEKLAVTPLGTPLTARAMAALNPVPPTVVVVIGTDPPRATLALVALNVRVKLPETVKMIGQVLAVPPPDTVTSSVEVLAATVAAAERDKMALPPPGPAMLVGKKLAVTPVGTPLIDNATAELNLLTMAVVNVKRAEPPGATVIPAALDVSAKLGVNTVRLKV
jgi:hypothetical protein